MELGGEGGEGEEQYLGRPRSKHATFLHAYKKRGKALRCGSVM